MLYLMGSHMAVRYRSPVYFFVIRLTFAPPVPIDQPLNTYPVLTGLGSFILFMPFPGRYTVTVGRFLTVVISTPMSYVIPQAPSGTLLGDMTVFITLSSSFDDEDESDEDESEEDESDEGSSEADEELLCPVDDEDDDEDDEDEEDEDEDEDDEEESPEDEDEDELFLDDEDDLLFSASLCLTSSALSALTE